MNTALTVTSAHVNRTVPVRPRLWAEAAASNTRVAVSTSSAVLTSAAPASVGTYPDWRLSKSFTPIALSSAAMRRAAVL